MFTRLNSNIFLRTPTNERYNTLRMFFSIFHIFISRERTIKKYFLTVKAVR